MTKKSVNINKMVSLADDFIMADSGDYYKSIEHLKRMIALVEDFSKQLGLNSQNSSIPPSQDKYKVKKPITQSERNET